MVDQLDHTLDFDKPDAYERIWRSLDREYGRFQYGVFSHVTDLQSIREWPKCENSADVYRLYKFIRVHYKALEREGQESLAETIKIDLLGKLRGKALGKSSTLIKRSGELPVIKKMLEIMRDEVDDLELQEIATGKNNSRSTRTTLKGNLVHTSIEDADNEFPAQVNYVGTRTPRSPETRSVNWADGFRDRGQHATPPQTPPPSRQMSNVDERGPRSPGTLQRELEERFRHKCIFCISNDHESINCTKYSPLEYKNILFRYRLCFNCHGQGHVNYRCMLPKLCTKPCGNDTKHSKVVCVYTT